MDFVLRIMGGLGNQLFQYATMRYLNLKFFGSKMFIDSRGYKTYKVRNYELKNFKLIEQVQDYEKSPIWYTLTRKSYHLYQYVYHRLNHKQAPMLSPRFLKSGLMYATIDYQMPHDVDTETLYLYGYFAKEDYIKEIKNVLRRDIQLKDPLSDYANSFMGQIRNARNAVGVSIRYGKDYQTLGWPICTPEYYRSAMDKIIAERGQCKFFIFSDSLETVINENWFDEYDAVYVDNCPVVESFMLLRACSDFVISNSSFCWWAAWLAENDNKIVYAPDRFYSPANSEYDKLIIFHGERILDYLTGKEV